MFDDFDEPTPDGMPQPLKKAPTIRLIFASDAQKVRFIEILESLPNIEIGASDSEPLFDVIDISVIVNEESRPTQRAADETYCTCKYWFISKSMKTGKCTRCGKPFRH